MGYVGNRLAETYTRGNAQATETVTLEAWLPSR